MVKALTELLQVKKIIAISLTLCFIYITIVGKVSSEIYLTVFSMIISFYFGQSTVRQATKESKE